MKTIVLIGDSIRRGYQETVREQLADWVEVSQLQKEPNKCMEKRLRDSRRKRRLLGASHARRSPRTACRAASRIPGCMARTRACWGATCATGAY